MYMYMYTGSKELEEDTVENNVKGGGGMNGCMFASLNQCK